MAAPSRSARGARASRLSHEQTLIAISSRGRMTARYGERGFAAVNDSLAKLGYALSAKGVKLVLGLVDDRPSMSAVGATPISRITAPSVKSAIDALREKVSARSKAPVSVLIMGGNEVIPYFKLTNPALDSDSEILSDNPYGSRPGALSAEKCLLPDVAVGRMPDGDGRSLDLLTGQIEHAAGGGAQPAVKERTRGIPAADAADHSFTYTAAVWKRATRDVTASLGWRSKLKVSPPLTYLGVKKGWFDGKTHLYFNLHGSDKEPYWYGQEADKYPTALSPRNVTNFVSGSDVVVSEACYGAIETGRKLDTSMALAFLSAGTQCFVGSTCVAYGALVPPVSEADLIARHFFSNLQKGMTAGKALVNARAQLAGLAVSKQGYLDEDDKKTLLQFVLFGDPTFKPSRPA